MADTRLRSAFQNPWLAALVGAAVVAASLTLTGNLSVGGTSAFTGAATFASSITVSGAGQVVGNFTNNGFLAVGAGARVSGAAGVDPTLEVKDLSANQTAAKSGINVHPAGTVDTTSGALTMTGLTCNISTARATGANALTNVCGSFTASGGQAQRALQTIAGDNYLNSTSGNTGIGVALGGTLSSKLTVTGDATLSGVVNEQGWTTLVQSAAQTVTNAQDTDSNTFTFAVSAGTIYAMHCDLFVEGSASANDFELRFAVSAGTMAGRGIVVHPSTADAATSTLVTVASAANTNQVSIGTFSGTSFPSAVTLDFAFVHQTTSGTFKLQFGNAVIGAGINSQIDANSRCRYRVLR